MLILAQTAVWQDLQQWPCQCCWQLLHVCREVGRYDFICSRPQGLRRLVDRHLLHCVRGAICRRVAAPPDHQQLIVVIKSSGIVAGVQRHNKSTYARIVGDKVLYSLRFPHAAMFGEPSLPWAAVEEDGHCWQYVAASHFSPLQRRDCACRWRLTISCCGEPCRNDARTDAKHGARATSVHSHPQTQRTRRRRKHANKSV